MADGSMKVADFGISKVLASADGTDQRATAGTLSYMPPESFHKRKISFAMDIWAVGCLIHEVINGEKTFPGDDEDEIEALVLKEYPRKLP